MKLSTNTNTVLNFIRENDGKLNLSTQPLLDMGISSKQIAAGVSVLVRKGLISKSPFKSSNKNYLAGKNAATESELRQLVNDFLALDTYSTKPLISFFKSHNRELEIMNAVTRIHDNTVKSLWHFIHGQAVPGCKQCGAEVTFKNFKVGYNKFCSQKCGSLNMWSAADEKWKDDRNKKTVKTVQDRYGVDWMSKMDDHADKIKATSLKRYGVTHAAKTNKLKKETKETFINRHGGMGTGSPTIAAKIKATMIRNHGVEYAWQIPDVQDKIQKSRKMFKDYTMPSGRVVRIQGYEHYGIDELLKTYDEDDIVISNREISEIVGAIFYTDGEKRRRYFPDAYVKSKNLIIEVKSTFTYYGRWHNENLLKQDACINAGLDFEFMVYDPKGVRIFV